MIKKIVSILVILFFIVNSYSQEDVDSLTPFEGDLEIRYAAEFNMVPIGCRANAMGNTGVVLPYTEFAYYWNPALVSLDTAFSFGVEGAKLYGGLSSFGACSFMAPVQKEIVTGLSYAAFFPGDIQQWDSLTIPYDEMQYKYDLNGFKSKGVFHNNKHRITATVAKTISLPFGTQSSHSIPVPVDLAIGLNIKALWETMTPDDDVRLGLNINIDLGTVLRLGVDYNLERKCIMRELLVSLSWSDLLPTEMRWLYSYENYEEPVSVIQNYGIAYIDRSGFLKADWTVALSLQKQYEVTAHAGLEALFFGIAAFRVGYSDGIATIGCGIRYKRYLLDYSFSFDELKYSPVRITAGVQF